MFSTDNTMPPEVMQGKLGTIPHKLLSNNYFERRLNNKATSRTTKKTPSEHKDNSKERKRSGEHRNTVHSWFSNTHRKNR